MVALRYLAVPCPRCKAAIGDLCVSRSEGRAHDSHSDRRADWWAAGKPDDPEPRVKRARDESGVFVSSLPEVRFWERVREDDSGCWIWTAGLSKGYGSFKVEVDRVVPAHRWAYEAMITEIPPGLHIDHLCRNPPCVNPWHMDPVTSGVNGLRGISPFARNARQTHCRRGGHEYTETNTIICQPGDRRRCRTCRNEDARIYRRRAADVRAQKA